MPVHATRTDGWKGILAVLVCLGGICPAVADEPAERTATPAATPTVTRTTATAAAPAATEAAKIVLAYKFQSGQFVHYSGTNRVQYTTQLGDQYKSETGTTSVEDRTFTSHQSNETDAHLRVVTVDEQGLALIEPVVDRTRMSARLHGKKPVLFDSADDLPPPPEFRAVRDAIGRTVARFQVAPTGKLIKAIIVDDNASASLREAAARLDTRFPYLSLLPDTPVSVGDKWREDYSTTVLNEGLKQPMPIRRIYQLTALADGIAVIKFKALVMSPVNDPELEKQIIQQTPTGTIEFDVERGLVRSYAASIDRTTINAFGPQSLLRVTGESIEKLVTAPDAAAAGKVTAVMP